jgi:hypothetical protein
MGLFPRSHTDFSTSAQVPILEDFLVEVENAARAGKRTTKKFHEQYDIGVPLEPMGNEPDEKTEVEPDEKTEGIQKIISLLDGVDGVDLAKLHPDKLSKAVSLMEQTISQQPNHKGHLDFFGEVLSFSSEHTALAHSYLARSYSLQPSKMQLDLKARFALLARAHGDLRMSIELNLEIKRELEDIIYETERPSIELQQSYTRVMSSLCRDHISLKSMDAAQQLLAHAMKLARNQYIFHVLSATRFAFEKDASASAREFSVAKGLADGRKSYLTRAGDYMMGVGAARQFAQDTFAARPPRRAQTHDSGSSLWIDEGGWKQEVTADERTADCPLDRRYNLTMEDFVEKYVKKGKPVILTGVLESWAAKKSFRREAFVDDPRNPLANSAKRLRDESLSILQKERLGGTLATDAREPLLFQASVFSFSSRERWLEKYYYVGGNRAISPFRVHTNRYDAVVYGNKLNYLLPPMAYAGREHRADNQTGLAEELKASEQWPVAPIKCFQQGGEVLFIPTGWFHASLVEKEAVGVEAAVGDSDMPK